MKSFNEFIKEVAGPKDCWDGYKKDGTQAGTGKNKGKRVNKCVPEESDMDEDAPTTSVASGDIDLNPQGFKRMMKRKKKEVK